MFYKKVVCYFTLCLFTFPIWLTAQIELTDASARIIEDYQKAKAAIFLLKNEEGLIPLKRLDTLKVACQSQHDSDTVFRETLRKYTLIEGQQSDQTNLSISVVNFSNKLYREIASRNGKFPVKVIGDFPVKRILVIFDKELILKNISADFRDWSQVIYVIGDSDYHQSLAAQLIFGAVGTNNKLDFTINDIYKIGDGLNAEGGLRLAYTPPKVIGLDAHLLRDSITKIALSAIDSAAFPGCQVLVAKDGHVVFHEAWGHHTYAKKRAVKTDDIYDYASVTKVTSALPALMKLHGEGRFVLDAPLKTYFPKFKRSNKAELPMREILAHQATLKPWIPYWRTTIKKNGKYKCRTFKTKPSKRFPVKITDDLYLHRKYKKRIYKAIKKSPLNEKKEYKYSGLAFYLFPEIVKKMVDQDFETYLKHTFYQPLGAYTITYNPARYFPPEQIIPTENDTFFRKVQIHGTVHDEGAIMMGGVSANAGLFSTANDLAKLMQMYLNGGTYGGERLIAEASVKEFTRCQFCAEGNHRGLGFDKPLLEYHPQKSSVAKDASPASFGHSGYTGTFTWVDPEYDLIYIFFSNRVFPTRENRKIYELNVRPRIHQVIYDSFLK